MRGSSVGAQVRRIRMYVIERSRDMLERMAGSTPTCNKRNGDTVYIRFRIVLCLCIVLLVSCTKIDEPDEVATELVEAFVAANVVGAKSVTVPEQWDRIEEWMEGRQPFICSGEKFMALTGAGGSGYYDAASNEWNWGLVYQCDSQQTPYCLEVNDIRIRETEGGWKVYDWGEICEAFDYAYRCGEICDN